MLKSCSITICIFGFFLSIAYITNFVNTLWAQTESEYDIKAEAQFEYYKMINDLEKRINEKNPQTYEELKQIAKDYFFERADHLKNLKPGVKLELCNMLSDAQNILLGSPYPSGLCESFASPNPVPHIPWEDCKYIEDKSAGTTVHKAQVGSSLIVDAKLSNYQVFLGQNQTITVDVKSSMSNGAEQNAPVQVSMSDSSGRAVHSIKGTTDINGSFSHSWTIDSESPNSFYSVTVMVKDSTNQNWISGTLYFNRNPDQTPSLRVCPWDNQSPSTEEEVKQRPASTVNDSNNQTRYAELAAKVNAGTASVEEQVALLAIDIRNNESRVNIDNNDEIKCVYTNRTHASCQ